MSKYLSSVLTVVTIIFITACQSIAAPVQVPPHKIIKSPNDSQEYRYLQLSNGVQVALVSSKETTYSSVVVNVHTGSAQEPDEWPGLAHLLEHMLFLGSDKYPGADDFDSYLSDHGGSSNAWTTNTDTLFYLTIPHAHYQEALERISRFFIAPKMDPDFLERERNAVDSEFQIYRQQDNWRFSLIEKATGNPAHPASRFSVGNLDTLKDHNGLNLREALLKFHDQWYFGSNISVAIVSNDSLDAMEKLAKQFFSPVQERKNPPQRPELPPLYTEKELGIRLDVVSLQQMRHLSLDFYLPTDPDAIYSKSLTFLAHLLGHEAKGSLASLLKKKGWIQELVTRTYDNTLNAGLTVDMSLTKAGFEHIDEITEQVFAYIKLIKNQGVTQSIFEELQKESDLAFRFLEQGSPEDTAISLASGMPLLPPEELIQSHYLFRKFSPEKITEYLNLLTPDNLRVRVATQNPQPDMQMEPWAGGLYKVQSLSEEQKHRFASAQPDPDLAIPATNPFMPDDLSIINEPDTGQPHQIDSTPGFSSWFLHDNKFNVPRGSIIIRFAAPHLVRDPDSSVRLALFSDLLDRSFSETSYLASLGGLHYNIWWDYRGFYLHVLGYNDKLPLFLETVLQQMQQLDIHEDAFDKSKELLEEGLNNADRENPSRLTFTAARKALYPLDFESEKQLEALHALTVTDLQDWSKRLFDNISITTLIYGNMESKTASSISTTLSKLVSGPDNNSVTHLPRVIKDSPQFSTCSTRYEKDDSALLVFSQGTQRDHKTRAVYQVMASIISLPFYAQLRTKEQLGYIVGAQFTEQDNFPGLLLTIQSPTTLPEQLDERVTAFLNQFQRKVDELTDDVLQEHKDGIVAGLTEPSPNLYSAGDDFWTDIDDNYPEFDQRDHLIKATRAITVKDIQTLYSQILKQKKQFRVYGYNKNSIPEHAPISCNAPDFLKQFIDRQ